MEIDTVAPLMLGSDVSHRAIDIAYLDRCGREADDTCSREGLLVLADVGIMAVAIEGIDDEVAPVAMLVGQARGDDPAYDRLSVGGIVQAMVVGRAMDPCFPQFAVSTSG